MQGDSPEQKSMERTYSQSQCGGPRAAMPAIGPPGPGTGNAILRYFHSTKMQFLLFMLFFFSGHANSSMEKNRTFKSCLGFSHFKHLCFLDFLHVPDMLAFILQRGAKFLS